MLPSDSAESQPPSLLCPACLGDGHLDCSGPAPARKDEVSLLLALFVAQYEHAWYALALRAPPNGLQTTETYDGAGLHSLTAYRADDTEVVCVIEETEK